MPTIQLKRSTKGRITNAVKAKKNRLRDAILELPEDQQEGFFSRLFNERDLDDHIADVESRITSNIETTTVQKPIEMAETTIEEAQIVSDPITTDAPMANIPSSFDPLAEDVIERSYTQTKTNSGSASPTPEPEFDITGKIDSLEEGETGAEPKKRTIDKIENEALNDLDPKDKNMAVEQMVNTVLDTYEMLHQFAPRLGVPQKKLIKLIQDGKIDPNLEMPTPDGDITNPLEFAEDFNQEIADAIQYDPKFGEEVKPAMKRVFAKRNWGLTDENYLMYMFGKDIAIKGTLLLTMRKTANEMIKSMVVATSQVHGAQARATKVTPDHMTTPPPKERTQARPDVSEVEVEDVIQENFADFNPTQDIESSPVPVSKEPEMTFDVPSDFGAMTEAEEIEKGMKD